MEELKGRFMASLGLDALSPLHSAILDDSIATCLLSGEQADLLDRIAVDFYLREGVVAAGIRGAAAGLGAAADTVTVNYGGASFVFRCADPFIRRILS
jgi:hypothetical protein